MKQLLTARARRRRAQQRRIRMTPERSRGRRAADFLMRLAFELLIIFVGVYAAFALSQHRSEREADVRRYQVREALIAEIESLTRNTRRVATSTPLYLASYDSLINAGQRPIPQLFLEPLNIETHMWEATLQSNALDLLDVPTVYRLSAFYNQLNQGFEQFYQLRMLSEQYFLPILDEGADGFYDETTGDLRPSFGWYRPSLRRLGSLAADITELGDTLAAELRRENEARR